MTTDHPQHSTNRSPRQARDTMPTDNDGVPLTEPDIIARIVQLADAQSTRFVSINRLRASLGLSTEDECAWLRMTLMKMDVVGLVLLSPLERPQDLSIAAAPWWAANAQGQRCHEITVADDASARTHHSCRIPPHALRLNFAAAYTSGLRALENRRRAVPQLHLSEHGNLQHKISTLVKAAAADLQTLGMTGRRSA
jgi:hypothetical protein